LASAPENCGAGETVVDALSTAIFSPSILLPCIKFGGSGGVAKIWRGGVVMGSLTGQWRRRQSAIIDKRRRLPLRYERRGVAASVNRVAA